MTKKQRREAAMKKAVKRKVIILISVVVCLTAICIFVILQFRTPDSRVFSDGFQAVSLFEDGTFNALLPHDVMLEGTFTEEDSDGITEITFNLEWGSYITTIQNNILIMPEPWRATCGHAHSIELPLTGS